MATMIASTSRSLLRGSIARVPATAASASHSILSHSSLKRSYATSVQTATTQEKQNILQERQLRLAEKAGRMKQNVGVLSVIPVFANYVRPRSTRTTPQGISLRDKFKYWKADTGNDIYTIYLRYKFRQALGKNWYAAFSKRAESTYITANKALATGIYTPLIPLSSPELISSIKQQRLMSFSGVRLSWRLHSSQISQDICCIRQQEIAKLGEFVAQVAVRFVSEQSLEVRDAAGVLIKGNHEKPVKITEYYVFQRPLWQAATVDWKMVKKVGEIDPFGKDRHLFQ